MKMRMLGQQMAVSQIGYGAMGLSEFYGASDEQQALRVLQRALETGVTLLDTADIYGRGHNERLLGHFRARLSAGDRSRLKIATKCGIERPENQQYARRINNHPDYIRRCCHQSLQRLGVEQIDLFYLHRIDPEADIEVSMACLAQLVGEGKIAHVGLSEASAATLNKAHRVFPITALQTEYSLWTRDIEVDVLPEARRLGIGVVAYSPLGRGFLTGNYRHPDNFSADDFRRSNPRFSAENMQKNAHLLELLEVFTQKYRCTSGQLALAWLLAQYDHLVPIPGTRTLRYLDENASAGDILLQAADLQALNQLLRGVEIAGERYTAEGMKGINA